MEKGQTERKGDPGRWNAGAISNPAEHLYTLQRSPYSMAPIIHQFYEESTPRERDVLLSFLVLPMVLFPPMRTFIINSNKKSSLRTLCQDQRRLAGLTTRVQELKSLTQASVLVLTAERGIEITPELSVKSIRPVQMVNTNSTYLETGRKLANLFSSVDITSIYRTLGFKSL